MISKPKRGLILILSSPSGAGKTTLAKKIQDSDSNFKISVSYTTRTSRPNEIDGVDYNFVDVNKFQKLSNQNKFLEKANKFNILQDASDDKFYTLIGIDQTGLGPKTGTIFDQDESLKWLGKATMGDLVTAQFRATGDTLIAINKPVRRITLSAIDEHEIGALLMHFMLETILAADLLGINAFDQPGVEQSKILARKYLTSSNE